MSTTAYFPVPYHLQAANPAAAQQYAPVAYPTAYAGVYTLPQYQQQAQQLFQKDAQIITPEAIENVKAALASSEVQQKADIKKRAIPCKAAGQAWEDPTLVDWPEDDFRLFCGDLGNEVVRDKRTGKTKGYGFVSFANPLDLASALKEMNGKYVGNRPIKLRKSTWKKRVDFGTLEKQKNQPQKKPKLLLRSVLHK